MFKNKFRRPRDNKNLPAVVKMINGLLVDIRIYSFFNAIKQQYIFSKQQEKILLSILTPSELSYPWV